MLLLLPSKLSYILLCQSPSMRREGNAKSLQSCLTLRNPMDCSSPGFSIHGILQARILEWVTMPSWVAHQAFLSMGFSRQEYWSGLPCPPPGGNLPNPGMEPASLSSSALAGRFFTTSATWWLIFTLVTRDGRINLYIESQIFTSSIYSPCLKLDFPWIQRFLHALVCKGYRNKLPQSEWQ